MKPAERLGLVKEYYFSKKIRETFMMKEAVGSFLWTKIPESTIGKALNRIES